MAAGAFAADLDRAQKLYDRTDYPAALDVLSKSSEPKNGAAWELAGKAHYQLGRIQEGHRSIREGDPGRAQKLALSQLVGPGVGTPRRDIQPAGGARLRLRRAESF